MWKLFNSVKIPKDSLQENLQKHHPKPLTSTEGVFFWACSKCGSHNSLITLSCKNCAKNKNSL